MQILLVNLDIYSEVNPLNKSAGNLNIHNRIWIITNFKWNQPYLSCDSNLSRGSKSLTLAFVQISKCVLNGYPMRVKKNIQMYTVIKGLHGYPKCVYIKYFFDIQLNTIAQIQRKFCIRCIYIVARRY